MPNSVTIGSRPDCDLVLRSRTVSGRHCRLSRDSAGYILEDLNSTNGTFFNGERVLGSIPVTLTPGDTIFLGSQPLSIEQVLALFEPLPAQAPAATLWLESPNLVIGRGRECDHVIDLPMISARHARMFRAGDRLQIEDLGSSNGTFVNGARITGPTVIADGDLIGLGSSTFVLMGGSLLQQPETLGATEMMAPLSEPPLPPSQETAPARTFEKQQSLGASFQPWRLAALLAQAPVLGLLIFALLGRGSTAPVLFWLAVGVIWFGLSSIVLSGLFDARNLRGLTQTGANQLISRLFLVAVLCVFQCLILWAIVAPAAALHAPGLPTLGLLILGSAVGLALGLLLVASVPRSETAWMILPAAIVLLWLFGGIWPPLLRVPVLPSAVPTRWTFEGLLLLESAEHPETDLAEDYFPAESLRMGVGADALALSFMLVGLLSAAAFISTSGRPRPPEPPASPTA